MAEGAPSSWLGGRCFIASVACVTVASLVVSASYYDTCAGGLDHKAAGTPSAGFGQASKTTLVFMGYNPARADNWPALLRTYGVLDHLLDRIIILWCNPAVKAPWEKVDDMPVPVEVMRVHAPSSSLNELFNISHLVRTTSVVNVDDDLLVSSDLMACMIALWNEDPRRLVGYGGDIRGVNSSFGYNLWPRAWYSMVLDKTWIFHRDYLEYYMRNSAVKKLVDETKNCEDIAMNSLITVKSGLPPTSIRKADRLRQDLGSQAGISTGKGHYKKRSYCTRWFLEKYGSAAFLETKEQRICLAGGNLQDWRCEVPGQLYEMRLSVLLFLLLLGAAIILIWRGWTSECVHACLRKVWLTRARAA